MSALVPSGFEVLGLVVNCYRSSHPGAISHAPAALQQDEQDCYHADSSIPSPLLSKLDLGILQFCIGLSIEATANVS